MHEELTLFHIGPYHETTAQAEHIRNTIIVTAAVAVEFAAPVPVRGHRSPVKPHNGRSCGGGPAFHWSVKKETETSDAFAEIYFHAI
ncbi:hypothetical protein RvY_16549 [Ramazzottius varieornatus]|uniref:Uncharacterized protein n=1 Tax=Ramazzottius varieornatus TaxID=947166 RepID=A0A1D1W1K5_RAMVA|nr:hypothetical protein RvY_16549 [Ramazzottius varieornatus]